MTETQESVAERRDDRAALDELRSWYADSLRPKLAQAAQAGRIPAKRAIALDRDVRAFLYGPA